MKISKKIFISLIISALFLVDVFSMESTSDEVDSGQFDSEIIAFVEKIASGKLSKSQIRDEYFKISSSNKNTALDIILSSGINLVEESEVANTVNRVKFDQNVKKNDGRLIAQEDHNFNLSYADNLDDEDRILYEFNNHFNILKNQPKKLSVYLEQLFKYMRLENFEKIKVLKSLYDQLPENEKSIFYKAAKSAHLPLDSNLKASKQEEGQRELHPRTQDETEKLADISDIKELYNRVQGIIKAHIDSGESLSTIKNKFGKIKLSQFLLIIKYDSESGFFDSFEENIITFELFKEILLDASDSEILNAWFKLSKEFKYDALNLMGELGRDSVLAAILIDWIRITYLKKLSCKDQDDNYVLPDCVKVVDLTKFINQSK